jgi:hypothetical protein
MKIAFVPTPAERAVIRMAALAAGAYFAAADYAEHTCIGLPADQRICHYFNHPVA